MISLQKAKKAVAYYFGITEKEICYATRKRISSTPRQWVCFLVSKDPTGKNGYTLGKIASSTNLCNHTVVNYAIKTIGYLIDNNPEFREDFEELSAMIENPGYLVRRRRKEIPQEPEFLHEKFKHYHNTKKTLSLMPIDADINASIKYMPKIVNDSKFLRYANF